MKTTRQPLPVDCLLGGRVHPSVAERLDRVKQLPVAAVANFLGLEIKDGQSHLVWQAIDGLPLAHFDADSRQRLLVFDQLRQVIEAMHSHGIVHGAIGPETVLIDASNRVRLTHISPLLYDDPQIDIAAIDQLIGSRAVTSTSEPIHKLRLRQWRSIAVTVAVGLLMFFGLLWYSQQR